MKPSIEPEPGIPSTSQAVASSLPAGIWLTGCILTAEGLLLSSVKHPWFSLSHVYIPGIIAFCAALVFFGRSRLQVVPQTYLHLQRGYAALHVGALASTAILYVYLLHFAETPGAAQTAIFLWCASIILMVVSLPVSFFTFREIGRILGSLGSAWKYAVVSAIFAILARDLIQMAWDAPQSPLGQALETNCFRWVELVLRLIYPRVLADPASFTIGTPAFRVMIGGFCSGIEGMTLMMVLTSGWLVYSRRELRLSRAAVLIPVALALMWCLNILRIVVLIAIGNAGYAAIAVGGFHSEAGWILFNLVGIAFLFAANRIAWFRTDAAQVAAPRLAVSSPLLSSDNPAAYLMPFLAILACSLLTKAASSGFETFYPLRLVVALIALWYFRASYSRLTSDAASVRGSHTDRGVDWRFGWLGPSVGAAVFLLWIALSRVGPPSALPDPIAVGLARLPGWQRYAWLATRVFAAVVTVPIAEELAFRGYLARRVLSPDVETVSLHRLNFAAILISSVAFGLMHGGMWIAGTLAGVVYAFAAKWRGRLGEAIAAHATSNLLLAAWVLTRHDYSLW